jgi:hypothetical protein
LLKIETEQIPSSHDLKFLFEQLSPQTRGRLRKEHDSVPWQDDVIGQFLKKIGQAATLDSLLEHGGKTFEIWRYPYEGLYQGGGGFGLKRFGSLVREYILVLHPEWIGALPTFPPR